jgi:hypothetical protein
MLKIVPAGVRVKPVRFPRLLRRRPEPVVLTSNPKCIRARTARGLIRRAAYVAVYVTIGKGGAADLLDVAKAQALRLLKNREECWLSELFGTVVIGRPEPI